MIGVELLVVKVTEPDLFARLIWMADRDPIAALAAIHLLGRDDRVRVLTDSVTALTGDEPAELKTTWQTPVGGRFGVLVGDLDPDGSKVGVHLSVQDPDIDWDDAPGLGLVRRLDQDFTLEVDGDPLPIVPSPQVIALIWPTTVAGEDDLQTVVGDRGLQADRVLDRYETATPKQRRVAVDQILR